MKHILNQANPNGRTTSFIAILQQFDLVFQNTKSQRSSHARVPLELGDPPNKEEETLLDELECFLLTRDEDEANFGYSPIRQLLNDASYPLQSTLQQRRAILRKSKPFTFINDALYRASCDGVLRSTINKDEASNIIPHCHEGFVEDISRKASLLKRS